MKSPLQFEFHRQRIEPYASGRVELNNCPYVSVEPFHGDCYLDEQVFRFNNRGGKKLENRVSDADRFTLAMSRINGKRLTYAKLTGKQVDSLHHSGGRDADRGRTLLARIFAGFSAAFRLWLCRSLFLWDGERVPHGVLELFPCFRPFVVFCFRVSPCENYAPPIGCSVPVIVASLPTYQ